jgi:hypothetical protein
LPATVTAAAAESAKKASIVLRIITLLRETKGHVLDTDRNTIKMGSFL